MADSASAATGMLLIIVLIAIGIAVYFLPSFIAALRRHKAAGGVIALNVFFGWTALGWIAAFIWAVAGPSSDFDPPAGSLAPCPFCAEEIKTTARICKHCHFELPEQWSSAQELPPSSPST